MTLTIISQKRKKTNGPYESTHSTGQAVVLHVCKRNVFYIFILMTLKHYNFKNGKCIRKQFPISAGPGTVTAEFTRHHATWIFIRFKALASVLGLALGFGLSLGLSFRLGFKLGSWLGFRLG